MFQSNFKVAAVCGLFAAVAMFTTAANAQSGSRGAVQSAVQSFTPTQSVVPSAGSGSRSFAAPTQTYQPAAPMAASPTYSQPMSQSYSQPMADSYSQPVSQSYAQPMAQSSGCGCGGGGSTSYMPTTTSYSPAPAYSPAPVYSQPVYTPSNYNPGTIFRPFRSRGGCGCGCN